jgi:type I restriction enzyme M protein
VIASWWGEVQNDLRTVTARRFLGLIEAWETSIVTALEDEKNKSNPLDHRLVRTLLSEYLVDLEELEAKKAELDAAIKSASGSDEDDEDAGEAEDGEDAVSEEKLAAMKQELKATKKALKVKKTNFTLRLREARTALGEDGARDLVLGILRAELDTILARYVAKQRQEVIAAFEGWWDKYRVTLTSVEAERDATAAKIHEMLREVGYA